MNGQLSCEVRHNLGLAVSAICVTSTAQDTQFQGSMGASILSTGKGLKLHSRRELEWSQPSPAAGWGPVPAALNLQCLRESWKDSKGLDSLIGARCGQGLSVLILSLERFLLGDVPVLLSLQT